MTAWLMQRHTASLPIDTPGTHGPCVVPAAHEEGPRLLSPGDHATRVDTTCVLFLGAVQRFPDELWLELWLAPLLCLASRDFGVRGERIFSLCKQKGSFGHCRCEVQGADAGCGCKGRAAGKIPIMLRDSTSGENTCGGGSFMRLRSRSRRLRPRRARRQKKIPGNLSVDGREQGWVLNTCQ